MIEIASKYAPFSHVPGSRCPVPGTHTLLQAFPTRLLLGAIEIPLECTGPVQDFTLQLDLEKRCVWVFGKAQEGFYRLQISANDEGFTLYADRLPEKGLRIQGKTVLRKESLSFPAPTPFYLPERPEKLSLGSHKAQDFDLILRRSDLHEILPLFYSLAQTIPPLPHQELRGTGRLIGKWEDFFPAAFSDLLIPRLKDDQFQGLCPDEPVDTLNPFLLFQEAFSRLRAQFFRVEDRRIDLLNDNPFDAGRMTNLHANGMGSFDLEWSKGILRRAIFRSETAGDLLFQLQKELKSFRLRSNEKEKGIRQRSADPFRAEEGKTYFLDRFEK